MTALYVIGTTIAGYTFLSRVQCWLSRLLGVVLIGLAALALAAPAWADQTILSSDSAQIDCTASAKDLTRISLVEDGFASVQKISTGSPQDDFSVVNEPVRGDIYLSVSDGFTRHALSFFATTKRGYVYKFVCRVAGDDAAQVFVSNPAIAAERERGVVSRTAPLGPQEQAIGLIQAMYGGVVIDGYEMRQRALRPVMVGALKVQLIAEYRGAELTGRVLRIENAGRTEAVLTEQNMGPREAVAVSIGEGRLAPGRVTTAYVVTRGSN